MNERATLTEIQSIRQKMAEAYHIQRQYKTILDVISGERIGYESQLTELEKTIGESKSEMAKLKVKDELKKNWESKNIIFRFLSLRNSSHELNVGSRIETRPFFCLKKCGMEENC